MNTNKDPERNEVSDLEPTDEIGLEGDLLTEVCASESTLGLGGQLLEFINFRQ